MQQELISPTDGNRLLPAIGSPPFFSPDQQLWSPRPQYLLGSGELFGPYSMFSPKDGTPASVSPPVPGSASLSLTPSSVSFGMEDAAAAATERRLSLARLALQYREIVERYQLCLTHLDDVAREAEELRQENAELRVVNRELTKRLTLLSGGKQQHNGRIAASLVDEFRRFGVGDHSAAETSPTSVLAFGESGRFVRPAVLPKSISIRSSGYLKLNASVGAGSASNCNDRLRVSSPIMVGSRRVHVGANNSKQGEESGSDGSGEGALEFEVYNQGMFKTELCNKWEETGECPYGEHCQFAHGIGELRPVIRHPRYKTEVCRMVLSGDTCPYGHRCHFRHTLSPSDRFLFRPSA